MIGIEFPTFLLLYINSKRAQIMIAMVYFSLVWLLAIDAFV